MDGVKAHYEGSKAFSAIGFTDDFKSIQMHTLVVPGDDDQIVPKAVSALLSAKSLRNCTLKGHSEAAARLVHDPRRPDQSVPACVYQ